jgi:cytochrome d ubiquinol oxidase subunit I
MSFSGWVATLAGWYVTEIGRQPYIVYGLLTTAETASSVPSSYIALTLALYVTVYLALIVAYVGVIRYLAEKPDEPATASSKAPAASAAGLPQGH